MKQENTIMFEGGDGSSMNEAVIIKGASNSMEGIEGERNWIGEKYPEWEMIKQVHLSDFGKDYDCIEINTPNGLVSVFFDITDFFGKY